MPQFDHALPSQIRQGVAGLASARAAPYQSRQSQRTALTGRTRASRGTFKTHVDEVGAMKSYCSTALTQAVNDPNKGTIDLYALLQEAKAKGIDLSRHYSSRELYYGKNISTDLTYADFSVGQFVWVPHPVPSLDPRLGADDGNAVWSRLGPLCVKRRPAVVVARYQDRMVVLPMYTHGGNGLDRKSTYIKELALYIVSGDQTTNTEREKTLRCDRLPSGDKASSVVYPIDPFSVSYSWPLGNQYEGRLGMESVAKLLQEYSWHMQAGPMELSRQAQYIKEKRAAAARTAGNS